MRCRASGVRTRDQRGRRGRTGVRARSGVRRRRRVRPRSGSRLVLLVESPRRPVGELAPAGEGRTGHESTRQTRCCPMASYATPPEVGPRPGRRSGSRGRSGRAPARGRPDRGRGGRPTRDAPGQREAAFPGRGESQRPLPSAGPQPQAASGDRECADGEDDQVPGRRRAVGAAGPGRRQGRLTATNSAAGKTATGTYRYQSGRAVSRTTPGYLSQSVPAPVPVAPGPGRGREPEEEDVRRHHQGGQDPAAQDRGEDGRDPRLAPLVRVGHGPGSDVNLRSRTGWRCRRRPPTRPGARFGQGPAAGT